MGDPPVHQTTRQSPSPSSDASEAYGTEEERIRATYARRDDNNRYTRFDPAELFTLQQRERRALTLLKDYGRAPLSGQRILDVGCGAGEWLRSFIQWGAMPENLVGIDLLPNRVDEATRLCPAAVTILRGRANELPFPDSHFDIVLQATVFTSVLDASLKRAIAAEMLRVVRADGLILWYDFHVNNPWNPDVRGVAKAEIRTLFPGCRIDLRRATLAPPICRRVARYSWMMCHLLETAPLLRTHYLGVIRKDSSGVSADA